MLNCRVACLFAFLYCDKKEKRSNYIYLSVGEWSFAGRFSFTNSTTSLNILCAFTTTYFDIVILEHTLDCSVRVTGENVGCPEYRNFES
jgi:hypothetical protein